MAQKDFTGKFFPIANANVSKVIPGAIIHMQTRNGEDEAIVGAGAMVYTGGDPAWVPVDQNNPIEARVRELEARIGEVSASPTANTLADRLRRIEEKLVLLESGNAKMQLTGSNVSDDQAVPTRLRGLSEPPVTGSVVVTATQVELKAGVSALAGRLVMIVYPPDTGTIYWGADGVTSTTGAPLGAGDPPIIFDFRPDVPISIFAVSDGQDRTVRVVEVK